MASLYYQFPLRNIFQKSFRYKASEMILKPAPCPGIRPNYHIIHQRYAGALGAQRCQGQLLLPRSYHSVAGQVPIHTELVSNRSFWESTLGIIPKMNSKPVQNHCSLFPLPFWTWVCKRDENYPKTKEKRLHMAYKVPRVQWFGVHYGLVIPWRV